MRFFIIIVLLFFSVSSKEQQLATLGGITTTNIDKVSGITACPNIDVILTGAFDCGCTDVIVRNGGGYGTTDWVDTYNDSLADYFAVNISGTASIYSQRINTSPRSQKIVAHIEDNSRLDLKTTGYNITTSSGIHKYKISLWYKACRCYSWYPYDYYPNSLGEPVGNLGLWKYYDDGTSELGLTLAGQLDWTYIEAEYTNDNDEHNMIGISFGHSQTVGAVEYRFELDQINLSECPE